MKDLTLPPEQMRQFGYRIVDPIADHLETLPERPAGRKTTPGELRDRFALPFPEYGEDPDAVVESLMRDVLSSRMKIDHPRFFAFVPGPGNFVSAMADALASGLNVFCGSWFSGSGPAAVELQVIEWLCSLAGFPSGSGGLMVSGGSVANLTAIAAARYARFGGPNDAAAVYFSDQTHSSVERALHVLGFRNEQIRRLPSDSAQRLPVGALHAAIKADRVAGLIPFCVVANAGTTNSGAVDPLREIADLCTAESMWLHVDSAYGAGALLVAHGRERLAGIECADSLALDPHKWLFQPLEAGCLLVRDPTVLRSAFRITPDYLREVHHDTEEINFCDLGIQLTRGFRALKLWLSLRIFGVAAFRNAVAHGLRMAEAAETRLRRPGVWEVITPAQLAIVTFRSARGAHLTRRIVDRANTDAYLVLTSTVIAGQDVLRFCTINPRTTIEDIESSVARLEDIAAAL